MSLGMKSIIEGGFAGYGVVQQRGDKHKRRQTNPLDQVLVLACEAGVSIEPGARAPGKQKTIKLRAHEMGGSPSPVQLLAIAQDRSIARLRGLEKLWCF